MGGISLTLLRTICKTCDCTTDTCDQLDDNKYLWCCCCTIRDDECKGCVGKWNKRKVHYDLAEVYGEYSIACYYTYWKNQGDIPMPNWEYTELESKVTCKRCLGMLRTDFRSIEF